MTLFKNNNQLNAKPLTISQDNPSVILEYAAWNLGAAKLFEKPTQPYCNEIKRAFVTSKED